MRRESSVGSRPPDCHFCLLLKSPCELGDHLARSTFNDWLTNCCAGGASHPFHESAQRYVLSFTIANLHRMPGKIDLSSYWGDQCIVDSGGQADCAASKQTSKPPLTFTPNRLPYYSLLFLNNRRNGTGDG